MADVKEKLLRPNRFKSMSYCHSKSTQMIAPVLFTVIPTLVVFIGGVTRIYHTDIRLAIGILVIGFNIATFALFGLDKSCAQCGSSTRMAEIVLFYMTFYGSPVGAILGMMIFHHKTAKREFLCRIIPLVIFNLLWLFIYFMVTAKSSLSSAFKE